MKFRLAFIILLLLFSFSCRKKIAEDYQYYQPYKRDTVSVKNPIPTASVTDTIQSKKIENFQIRPVDLNNKYFIVIASFSVEQYALIMKDDLIKKGFKPEIFMLNTDGWHKLAIGSYNNFEEATEAMNKIKLRGGHFSNARIVIK
jgi:cell division protein FtsN